MSNLEQLLEEATSHPVRGWDFSWLGDRHKTAPLPWNFEWIVDEHAKQASDLLDMGTGGGEWLAALPHRPSRTVATEAWPPNVAVAEANLRPLGITVIWVEGAPDNVEQKLGEQRGRLPFPAASFELVTNRHESFLASEVARVLCQRGVFLTQQTGGVYDDFYDALLLPRPKREGPDWNLDLAKSQVEYAGLEIVDGAESKQETTFTDVGALAWYLRAIPWVVEGFSIEAHRSCLEQLQRRIEAKGSITLSQPSFWLKAMKTTSTIS
jgi:SAM-dependent methyltransferase